MSIEYPCVYWIGGMCKKHSGDKVTNWCVEGPCGDQMLSNADIIRSMSDEELAEFIDRCEMSDIDYAKTFCDLCNGQYGCDQCRLDWLRKPAE